MLKSQQKKLPRQGAVKVYRDGREVCSDNAAGKREYERRTTMMYCRQMGRCSICGRYMMPDEITFEHQDVFTSVVIAIYYGHQWKKIDDITTHEENMAEIANERLKIEKGVTEVA